MKKILALALALIMVLALAACSGGNDTPDPSGSGTSQQEQPSNTSGNGSEQQSGSASDGDKTHDLTTIEGYLAQFGLTQDFLKTPSFTRFNGNRNLSTQQISGINVYQSAEMDVAQKEAWAKGVNDALVAASDDGKISSTPYAIEYSLDVDYTKGTLVFAGTIQVNGKAANFTFSITNGLDSDDPDDSYPAATFGIQYP